MQCKHERWCVLETWNRMSVFGGESWAREAQYRKRRVDDLLVEGLHGSSFKKLASGKYACLVCRNNPVLDSPLMLSVRITTNPYIADKPFSSLEFFSVFYDLFFRLNGIWTIISGFVGGFSPQIESEKFWVSFDFEYLTTIRKRGI